MSSSETLSASRNRRTDKNPRNKTRTAKKVNAGKEKHGAGTNNSASAAAAARSKQRREQKNKKKSSGKLEVDNEIGRQRAIVARLRSENKSLEQELSLEKHLSAVTGRDAAQKEIEKLQSTGDKLARRIQQEKRRIEQLDANIAETHEKIAKQNLRVGGANASKENAKRLDKHIKLLEARLDNALKKYNKSLAVNKELRREIDEARQERVIFDGVYKKLEWQLHANKKRVKELDKQAEVASQARDSAKKELRKITEEAEQARLDFEKHWRELGEEIQADRAAKNKQNRDQNQLAVTNAQLGVDGDGTKGGSSDLRADTKLSDSRNIASEIARSKWSIGKDKIHTVLSIDKVKEYEEAFKKIQVATGIKDIETLVTQFIEAEDNNFALYSHVNRLSAEAERLESTIAETRQEIEKYRGHGVDTINQRKRILKSVEKKLENAEKKSEEFAFKHHEVSTVLSKLRDGVQRLFTRIGCYSPEVAEMLGDQGVNDGNIMQYLGIIEQRANEILHMHAASESGGQAAVKAILVAASASSEYNSRRGTPTESSSKKISTKKAPEGGDIPTKNYDSILGGGPSTQHVHKPIHVEPPDIDSFDAEGGLTLTGKIISERPIPREELQRKTQEKILESQKLKASYALSGSVSQVV
jgi:exonuclease VII small subunit